jgi:hypothetical protein
MRLLLPALLLAVCPTGVDVRPAPAGRFDFAVQSVPLAEALECLSQRTGLKVIYDGVAAPRQLVSTSVKGATIAEAVEKLFEAQGMNYALGLDERGKRAGLLVVSSRQSGASSAGGSSPPAVARAPEPIPEFQAEIEAASLPPEIEEPAEGTPPPPSEGKTPLLPGMMGMPPAVPGAAPNPGSPTPFGKPDPRFRPIFPEPTGLSGTTQP